jgi:signal transduction histidine kinase
MDAAQEIIAIRDPSPILAVADPILGRRIAAEVERFATTGRIVVASSLLELRLIASRSAPRVIGLDCDLFADSIRVGARQQHAVQPNPPLAEAHSASPLTDALDPLVAIAPVVLFGPVERHVEIAPLIVSGDVEFVARAGDFAPVVANLIERRLRWAEKAAAFGGPPWTEFPGDVGAIFRHEINNPLTGILGNAELVLAHRDRLAPADTQRLQIVVDLAVRLRETIRRLSNAWEQRPTPAKSA